MASLTIGFVTFDLDVTDDKIFVQWQDALDLDAALVEDMLWAGYDATRDLAPPAMLAEDPMSEETARKLYRSQVLLARSNLARSRPAEGTGVSGEDFALNDLSRRLFLEARTVLRPRSFKGIR